MALPWRQKDFRRNRRVDRWRRRLLSRFFCFIGMQIDLAHFECAVLLLLLRLCAVLPSSSGSFFVVLSSTFFERAEERRKWRVCARKACTTSPTSMSISSSVSILEKKKRRRRRRRRTTRISQRKYQNICRNCSSLPVEAREKVEDEYTHTHTVYSDRLSKRSCAWACVRWWSTKRGRERSIEIISWVMSDAFVCNRFRFRDEIHRLLSEIVAVVLLGVGVLIGRKKGYQKRPSYGGGSIERQRKCARKKERKKGRKREAKKTSGACLVTRMFLS